MSYSHRDPFRPHNGHGVQQRTSSGYDSRRTPRAQSLQPIQGGGVTRANRSSSTTRLTAPGQAQFFDGYAAALDQQSDHLRHVPSAHTRQYGPQSQIHRQYRTHPLVDQDYPQLEPHGPFSQYAAPHSEHHQVVPQQSYVPHNSPHPTSLRYDRHGDPDSPRNQQWQQPFPSQPSVPPFDSDFGSVFPPSYDSNSPGSAPTCRYPGCYRPVTMDERTRELIEYCGLTHMRADIQRGVPMCLACHNRPRNVHSDYCGSSCERWAVQQQPLRRSQWYPQ